MTEHAFFNVISLPEGDTVPALEARAAVGVKPRLTRVERAEVVCSRYW